MYARIQGRSEGYFSFSEPHDTPSRSVHAHLSLYAMVTLKGLRRFLMIVEGADVTHYFYKVSLTFKKLKKICISFHDLYFHFINIVHKMMKLKSHFREILTPLQSMNDGGGGD